VGQGLVLNQPCAGCFKILLNTAVGKDTKVGYFVLN